MSTWFLHKIPYEHCSWCHFVWYALCTMKTRERHMCSLYKQYCNHIGVTSSRNLLLSMNYKHEGEWGMDNSLGKLNYRIFFYCHWNFQIILICISMTVCGAVCQPEFWNFINQSQSGSIHLPPYMSDDISLLLHKYSSGAWRVCDNTSVLSDWCTDNLMLKVDFWYMKRNGVYKDILHDRCILLQWNYLLLWNRCWVFSVFFRWALYDSCWR